MIKIEYPDYTFKTRKSNGVDSIFDPIRKRWIMLTPEEWVRQNILAYLIMVKGYPASLLAIEKEIRVGELKKRCDIVVYDKNTMPWMIVECKEMNVGLDHKVLDQVLRYHSALPARYLVITNGSYCYGFQKINQQFIEMDAIPDFEQV